MSKIIIFPGWGYPADFYNFFRDFYNEVEIMSGYEVLEEKKFSDTVLAWSMGAINFLINSKNISAKNIILISPALKFTSCVKSSYIKAMIKKLKTDKRELLADFYKINFYKSENYKNYISGYLDSAVSISDIELENGLQFLLNTSVENIELNSEIQILCGENDNIIPYYKSKEVAEKLNCRCTVLKECGHNLIYESRETVIELLRSVK